MSEWIAFSEREPSIRDTQAVYLASRYRRASLPIRADKAAALAKRSGWTHWAPCEPPADLPPKPLPELPEGWEWRFEENKVRVAGEGFGVHVAFDDVGGEAFVWDGCLATCGADIPLAVIDALREMAGR